MSAKRPLLYGHISWQRFTSVILRCIQISTVCWQSSKLQTFFPSCALIRKNSGIGVEWNVEIYGCVTLPLGDGLLERMRESYFAIGFVLEVQAVAELFLHRPFHEPWTDGYFGIFFARFLRRSTSVKATVPPRNLLQGRYHFWDSISSCRPIYNPGSLYTISTIKL